VTEEKVVGVALCVFCALMLSYHTFELLLLRRCGVRTIARVVRLEEHVDTESGGSTYFPVVAFTPPDGTEVEVEINHEVPSAEPGSFIYVLYNPRKPTTASAEEGFAKELVACIISAAICWCVAVYIL